ncbi:MAG: hypothetical protein ACI3W8_01745 [Oscillospiraceae bacterium]
MRFANEEKSLTITVKDYEFPERTGNAEEYDYDANWLVLRGVYREGRSERSFENSCLLTGELLALSAGLKLLAAGVRDSYESEFNDPYFEVTAEVIGLGRYLIYAAFSMLVEEDRWESFGVESFLDDAGLKALIAEVDEAARAFPEKKG